MTFSVLIAIIVEIITTVILCVFIIIKKKEIGKNALYYAIPALLINLYLCLLAATKNFTIKCSFLEFTACVQDSIDAFKFKVSTGRFIDAYQNIQGFSFAHIYSVICSSLALVAFIISFAQMYIFNAIERCKYIRKKKADIIVGSDIEVLKAYARKSRKEDGIYSVLYIDSNDKKLSYKERKQIYFDDFVIINKPLDFEHLKKWIKLNNDKCHIVCFNHKKGISKYLKIIEDYNIEDNITTHIYIECETKYNNFINEQLHEAKEKHKLVNKKNFIATSFDKYDLIGKNFNLKHSFAYYINRDTDFINKALLEPNKKINVVMLGMGKTNHSMLESLIVNNQFVAIENNKFKAVPVNYYLYDENGNLFNTSLITSLKQNFDLDKLPEEEYLEKPEKIAIIKEALKQNVRGENFINKLAKEFNSDDEYTFFFVGLSSSIDNANYTRELMIKLGTKNKVFFYNVDSQEEAILGYDEKHLVPYGFKNDMFKSSVICNDSLVKKALIVNDSYDKMKKETNNFYEKVTYEQLSNLYNAISLRMKLNLLGLDFSNCKEDSISKSDFTKDYFVEKAMDSKYEEFREVNIVSTICNIEHLRWNALYLVNGFMPMSKQEYIERKKNPALKPQKDYIYKKHINITSHDGLDQFHRFVSEIEYNSMSIEDKKKTSMEALIFKNNVYKYDTMGLDNLFEEDVLDKNTFIVKIK